MHPDAVDRRDHEHHRPARWMGTEACQPFAERHRYRADPAVPRSAGDTNLNSSVPMNCWYAPATMAKAKRRKLRARRKKANHGRRPNAGRG